MKDTHKVVALRGPLSAKQGERLDEQWDDPRLPGEDYYVRDSDGDEESEEEST